MLGWAMVGAGKILWVPVANHLESLFDERKCNVKDCRARPGKRG